MNEPIHKTLAELAELLEAKCAPYAIIGGIAVSIRGEPRFTADVDIVVAADLDESSAILQVFEDSQFAPLFDDAADLIRTAFLLPLRHRQTGISVDVAVGVTGFERQMIERAPIEELAGCNIPVVTAEDLILMKLLAARPRDLEDASRIVVRQRENIDWDYLLQLDDELQRAFGQDLVPQLRELQQNSPGLFMNL